MRQRPKLQLPSAIRGSTLNCSVLSHSVQTRSTSRSGEIHDPFLSLAGISTAVVVAEPRLCHHARLDPRPALVPLSLGQACRDSHWILLEGPECRPPSWSALPGVLLQIHSKRWPRPAYDLRAPVQVL